MLLKMDVMNKFYLSIFFVLFSAVSFAQSPCGTMLMNEDTVVFPGSMLHLEAQNMFQYQWSPALLFAHPENAEQTVIMDTSTTFFVTGYYQDTNIVVNGDFSAGNTGFVSNYTYVATPGGYALWAEGTYAVGTNSASYHSNFSACYDHTTGSGNYMIVNGATVTNMTVWSQTIPVIPNTNYVFTTWTQTFSSPVADLQFSINGVQIGNIFQSPTTIGTWQQFYQIWNSGTSTQAVITILNQNTTAGGNDFGLDDISFCPLYPCTDSFNVEVIMPIVAVNDTFIVCQGDSLTVNPLANDSIDSRCGTVYPYVIYPTFYTPIEIEDSLITFHFDYLYNGMDSLQYEICCGGHCDTATMYFIVTGSHETYVDSICAGEPYHKYGFDIEANQTLMPCWAYLADSNHTMLGCDSITELYLHILAQPNIAVDYFGCDTFRWNDQTILESGVYQQTFVAQSGCDSIVTATITVKHDTIHVYNFYEDFCANLRTTLYAESDLLNVEWNTGENVPIIDITEPGIYYVVASENDCIASDTVEIEVCCPDSAFFVPNVITPSQHDGLNDIFKIYDEFLPKTVEIYIFDRWGRRVFNSTDPKFEWDGSSGGKISPGVYYYSLKMNHRCDFHGSVTVF